MYDLNTKKKERICIIVAYFGEFPHYLPLWLKSIEMNPTVDFLLITDGEVEECPANMTIYKTKLSRIQKEASEVLGFKAALERPYKLCDYRPMYGLLFKELLQEYDYWGHCDIDMIFGDLRTCFEKYGLNYYDRFLPLGHLSLYRNTDEVNNRFMSNKLVPGYKEVYSNEKNFVFDEMPGMTCLYHECSEYSFFEKRVFADIASIYHRYRVIEEYPYDAKPRNYPYQIFTWENGKCFREWMEKGKLYKEEYVYIHFKKRPNFTVDYDVLSADGFYITNTGFYVKSGETTMDIINSLNPYPGMLYETGEYIRKKSRPYIEAVYRKAKRLKWLIKTS